jgi:hypothetical protein
VKNVIQAHVHVSILFWFLMSFYLSNFFLYRQLLEKKEAKKSFCKTKTPSSSSQTLLISFLYIFWNPQGIIRAACRVFLFFSSVKIEIPRSNLNLFSPNQKLCENCTRMIYAEKRKVKLERRNMRSSYYSSRWCEYIYTDLAFNQLQLTFTVITNL